MKYVLITGGSRGLGKELAYTFAEAGYHILLNYKQDEVAAQEVKQTIMKQFQQEVLLLQGDISKQDDVLAMREQLIQKNISLDVLVLNAGIDHVCDILEKTYDDFVNVLNVNLLGNFLMMQTFGLMMEEAKKGCVIIINSDNIIDQNDPVTLEYDVSKAGLYLLAKDYAKYFQYVKVHSIAPGWLDTDMNMIPADIKEAFSFIPLKQVAMVALQEVENLETGNLVRVKNEEVIRY